jgi:transposase
LLKNYNVVIAYFSVIMGKKPDINDFVKGQIVTLNAERYSQRDIAKKLKISRGAVENVLRSGGVSRRSNCKGVRKTNHCDDRYLKSIVVSSPHTSSARVASLASDRGIQVSARTVRRRLSNDFGLVARRPAKKPLITKQQLLQRLKFCRAMKDKSREWWERVMFTDESTFQQLRGPGYNYVRRPASQRFNPKYTIKTVKHPPSVMIWGGITASGRCGLHIFDKGEKVNAKKYLEVLESKLQIHMNISGATIMQQDSAPCHTAKIVQKWFSDNNIELLSNWPSNSPDLNVIENCWQIMKRKVAAHRPTSEKDLKEVLKRV